MPNQEKIERLKQLGAEIKKKPLRNSDYQFLNPPLSAGDFNDQPFDDSNFPDIERLDFDIPL